MNQSLTFQTWIARSHYEKDKRARKHTARLILFDCFNSEKKEGTIMVS